MNNYIVRYQYVEMKPNDPIGKVRTKTIVVQAPSQAEAVKKAETHLKPQHPIVVIDKVTEFA